MVGPVPPDFDGQFMIATGALPPDRMAGTEHAGTEIALPSLSLRVYPECPRIHVRDAAGTIVGILLGRPVDMQRSLLLKESVALPAVLEPGGDLDGFVEEHIYALSGSFLFLLDYRGARRLYLDAGGSQSAVFDPEARLAGATSPLLLDPEDAAERFESELYRCLDIRGTGWFPAGLTAHGGVERVLPNHYLDLDSWTQHRHWPTAPLPAEPDSGVACERIVRAIFRTVDALRRSEPLAVSLTAGNETRLILAACRSIVNELEFVTAEGPSAYLDVHGADQLATMFGLRHRVLSHRPASEAEADEWHMRAGMCVGDGNMWNHPTVRPLSRSRTFIAGGAGEVGRAFFWQRTDTGTTRLTADALQARFGMPAHPRVTDAVARWLRGVEGLDPLLVLDLAYLELRAGCWGFVHAYALPDIPEVNPMVSRESFSAMLSLAPEARRANTMITKSIELAWPELLAIPINRYGDYRDTLRLIQRAIKDPNRAARKIRQLIA